METKHTPRYYWDEEFPAREMNDGEWREWRKEHAPWLIDSETHTPILKGEFRITQEQANFLMDAVNQRDDLLNALQDIANYTPASKIQPALIAREVLEKHDLPWVSSALAQALGQ